MSLISTKNNLLFNEEHNIKKHKLMNIIGVIIIPDRITEKNKTAQTLNYNSEAESAKRNFDGKIYLRSTSGEKKWIQERVIYGPGQR
jgi:hypothetical protein